MLDERIEVKYEVYSTMYRVQQVLETLPYLISLDFEVRPILTNADIKEAKDLLKEEALMSHEDTILCKQVANSSGLSYPSLTKVTHVNIGLSRDTAIVIVVDDDRLRNYLMNWFVTTDRHIIFHNALFDAKLIYYTTGKLPKKYDDTQLLARCLINHTQDWMCKTGLKELMSSYYDRKWGLIEKEDYFNEDLKNEDFIRYCSIDAAGTYFLYEQLQEEIND